MVGKSTQIYIFYKFSGSKTFLNLILGYSEQINGKKPQPKMIIPRRDALTTGKGA